MTTSVRATSTGYSRVGEGSTYSEQAVLGDHASRVTRTGTPLRFDDRRHLDAHHFLIDEAYLLDAQEYETWLDNITDDIHYIMPVRVTAALNSGFDTSPGMAHFDENKYSLSRRVARFVTARHCMQALWKVGVVSPQHQQQVVAGLVSRFLECASETNSTLIRYDILSALRKL